MTSPPGRGRIGPYELAEDNSGPSGETRAAAPDGRTVLVRRLHSRFLQDPVALQGLSSALQHLRRERPEQIVPVLAADLAAGEPYLVTVDLPGPTWEKSVAATGPRSGGELQSLARDLALAVGQVHQAGIPYGVLTASTVLLVDGRPHLDIGYLCAAGPGVLPGSESFTAPEVKAGASPDSAADVFAWAALTLLAATNRPPAAPFSAAGTLPPTLRSLVRRALSTDPHARPELAQIITDLGGRQITSGVVPALRWADSGSPEAERPHPAAVSKKVTRTEVVLISIAAMTPPLVYAVPAVGLTAAGAILAIWAALAAAGQPDAFGLVLRNVFRFVFVAAIFLVLAMLLALVAPALPPELVLPCYLAGLVALYTGAQVAGAFHARHQFPHAGPAWIVGLTVAGSALAAIVILQSFGEDPVWWPLDQDAQDALVDIVGSCPSELRFLCR